MPKAKALAKTVVTKTPGASGLIQGTKIRERGHILLRLKTVLYRDVANCEP